MPTIKFFLDHPKADNPASVHVEYYEHIKFRPTFATGERIKKKDWDSKKQRAKSSMTGATAVNQHLSKLESDLMQVYRDHKHETEDALYKIIEQTVKGVRSVQSAECRVDEKKKLFEALEKFIALYREEKEAQTVKRYLTLQTTLIEFDKVYPIDFDNLDMNFYDEFKKRIYNRPAREENGKIIFPNHNYIWHKLIEINGTYTAVKTDSFDIKKDIPVPIFDDTVYKYIMCLKTLLTWAQDRGYPVNSVYKKWKIIKRKHDTIAIELEEMEAIEALELSGGLDVARDYFILECRTGARISNTKRFNKSNIQGENLIYKVHKGNRLHNKQIILPLTGFTENAFYILQKYNFKMPEVSEQKINKHIKKVCQLAGLTKEIYIERWAGSRKVLIPGKKYEFISTHVGKATFVTTLHNRFEWPVNVIMQVTGNSDIKTIMRYLGKSNIETLKHYLNRAGDSKAVMKKAN